MRLSRFLFVVTAVFAPVVTVAHAAPVTNDGIEVIAPLTVTSDAVQILALNDHGAENRTSGGGGNGPGTSDDGSEVGGGGGGGGGGSAPDEGASVSVPSIY